MFPTDMFLTDIDSSRPLMYRRREPPAGRAEVLQLNGGVSAPGGQ